MSPSWRLEDKEAPEAADGPVWFVSTRRRAGDPMAGRGSGLQPQCVAAWPYTVGVLLPPRGLAGDTQAAAQERGLSAPWWPEVSLPVEASFRPALPWIAEMPRG